MFGWQKILLLPMALSFSLFQVFAQDKQSGPVIQIGFFHVTGGIERQPDGTVTGGDADKIRNFMKDRPLHYEWVEMPWVRLYRFIHSRENMLISNLLRTPDREERFHWLLLLEEERHFLISRKEDRFVRLTKELIAAGPYTAVCDQQSAQCKMLLDIGFSEDRILQVYSMTSGDHARLVASGRVDFMIDNLAAMETELVAKGIDKATLYELIPLMSSATYLAAPKAIAPTLLKILQQP